MMEISWKSDPFPYLIIDNYLIESEYDDLINELNSTNPEVQTTFSTALEDKQIYRHTSLKSLSKRLVSKVGSKEIKDIISKFCGELPILSLGETKNFSGYSPFHITKSKGMLGSHVDHSDIQQGEYLHIANTIYYVSSKWEIGWGGETVLFSRNGFLPKVNIQPIPNRLIIFIHTSNSFHGVRNYHPLKKVYRKTFYHDYYIEKKYKEKFIKFINLNRKNKLSLSSHGTTFIPFFPNGLMNFNSGQFFSFSNLKYIPIYMIYLFNKIFKTRITSIKKILFRR